MASVSSSGSPAKFVVAIDFGTTRSGIAFGDYRDPDKVETYDNFPGVELAGQKTRTDVLLRRSDLSLHSFGDKATSHWSQVMEGNGAEAKELLFFSRFKMALFDEDQLRVRPEIPAYNDPTVRVSSVTLIAACLQHLSQMALDFATKRQVNHGRVQASEVQWVVTVPAIWSQGGKQVMREAALKAGLISELSSPRLMFALEPEAAAIYCRQWLSKSQGVTMQTGEQYVILDCGGGTIDSIVHEVTASGSAAEMSAASGGPWGSTKVNDAFERFLRKLLGSDVYKSFCSQHPHEHYLMMERFDRNVKHDFVPGSAFNGGPLQSVSFRLPHELQDVLEEEDGPDLKQACRNYAASVGGEAAQLDANNKKFTLIMPYQLVHEWFAETIDQIVTHAADLLRRHPKVKYFLLVGGFASCPLLVDALAKSCRQTPKLPFQPALAVVGGACLQGLSSPNRQVKDDVPAVRSQYQVSHAVMPRTFGIDVGNVMTSQARAAGQVGYWQRDDKTGEVSERYHAFFEFVARGERVERNALVQRDFTPCGPGTTIRVLTTLASSATYSNESGVKEAGSLCIQLPPKSGVFYADRSVRVTMRFGGSEVMCEAVEIATGTKVAATINFLN